MSLSGLWFYDGGFSGHWFWKSLLINDPGGCGHDNQRGEEEEEGEGQEVDLKQEASSHMSVCRVSISHAPALSCRRLMFRRCPGRSAPEKPSEDPLEA